MILERGLQAECRAVIWRRADGQGLFTRGHFLGTIEHDYSCAVASETSKENHRSEERYRS